MGKEGLFCFFGVGAAAYSAVRGVVVIVGAVVVVGAKAFAATAIQRMVNKTWQTVMVGLMDGLFIVVNGGVWVDLNWKSLQRMIFAFVCDKAEGHGDGKREQFHWNANAYEKDLDDPKNGRWWWESLSPGVRQRARARNMITCRVIPPRQRNRKIQMAESQ